MLARRDDLFGLIQTLVVGSLRGDGRDAPVTQHLLGLAVESNAAIPPFTLLARPSPLRIRFVHASYLY